jgi:hypothetical protein
MARPLPNARYEYKFLADGLPLASVLARVRDHPALFREVYPPRVVNNVYLDSPGLRDYFDHVAGAAHRVKTRIRWYGDWDGPAEHPSLERKIKNGHLSGKLTHRWPPFAAHPDGAHAVLAANLDQAEIPELLRAALRHLQPSLANRYHRHYLQSADGCFRLTVDSDLRFGRAGGDGRALLQPALRSPGVIVELKFDPRRAANAPWVANSFAFRLARCSKYVLGITRCRGN